MTRIVVVACRNVRQQNLCPGFATCFVAFTKREGEYKQLS